MTPSHLTALDPAFPSRLRALHDPPASISTLGGPVEASRAVAIVGSRKAGTEVLDLARELARSVARAGSVVVSGGAVGVDAAAHVGAMEAGGATWAVAGTGHEHCFPQEHAKLFERIARGPGAMVWPFAPRFRLPSGFVLRNRVLVALSDVVVVLQAGEQSGALNAASWAKKLGKPLWVAAPAPWMPSFEGSVQLLADGARELVGVRSFLSAIGLGGEVVARPASLIPVATDLSPESSAVFRATPSAGAPPAHIDSIATASGQTAQVASAALLTLALENVVVEGPSGFFRRTNAHK